MLNDPQSVTINSVATSLPKTQPGPNQNVFTSADGLTSMTTKQNLSATRFRREARLSQSKVAADPISAINKREGFSVYFVVDEPRNGVFTDAEIKYLSTALVTWLSGSSYANHDKLLGGEF